jgi:hypothetical protein
MSLEELSLYQQITEAVVAASLDVDSVLDQIDNERAQIVELQSILLARRQRAIGSTNLATLALSWTRRCERRLAVQRYDQGRRQRNRICGRRTFDAAFFS